MSTLSDQISVPFEWVASYLVPHASHERAAHIKIGDVVRVVDVPDRRGQVVARQEYGAMLSLTDLQTNQIVSHNIGL
jgi:hypothetical protein